MTAPAWKDLCRPFDKRRQIAVPGSKDETLDFCVQHWVACAQDAIEQRGKFFVALSGGSTPKAIFERLPQQKLDWSKVWVFWSDERSVPPEDPDSNYRMAMDAGLAKLPIPPKQIFRMEAEEDTESHAEAYAHILREKLPDGRFDLIMLGMGDDGHTASLFPQTGGLQRADSPVIANWVTQKDTWRMTFTFGLIDQARCTAIYVLGAGKADMLHQVLEGEYNMDLLPSQRLGTEETPALWIVDQDAAAKLNSLSP